MKIGGSGVVALGLLVLFVFLAVALFSDPDYSSLPPADPYANLSSAGSAPGISQPMFSAVQGLPIAMQNPAQARAVTPTPMPGGGFYDPGIQLSEGHWQGLEALPLSGELKKKLKLPKKLKGLLIDEVSLYAALSGMMAGDVMVAINNRPVYSLEDLIRESKRVQQHNFAKITVYRKEDLRTFTLMVAPGDNLGFAQVETAPMILPGDMRPHPYRGPCTSCHAVGTSGHMVPDPDGIILPPPPIMANARVPHQDRGPCQACHKIIN